MVRKLFLSLLLLGLVSTAYSQKYWVFFTGKPGAAERKLHPQRYLSKEAIERRRAQGIEIDFRDVPVHRDYIAKVTSLTGVSLVHRSKWFNSISVDVASGEQIDQIGKLPFVKRIEPITTFKQPAYKNSDDKFITPVRRMKTTAALPESEYGEAYGQLNLYNLIPLHDEGFMGGGLKIALFDAGFNRADTMKAFDRLRERNNLYAAFDLVDGDTLIYDHSRHGTDVLSAMASWVPGELIGPAPDAAYFLFRTEDTRSETLIEEDNWVAAAEKADSMGIDIINSSLGYTQFDDTLQNHSYSDMDGNTTIVTRGADIAASKGILVVNSAGNWGNRNWKYIGAPADGDSVLSVGAVNVDGMIAGFSSYGPTHDGRVKPNVCAVGEATALYNHTNEVIHSNGTSFSSPQIAGAAAALWGKHPNVGSMDIFRAIERSGDRYNNPDDHYGYGIPDFKAASDSLEARFPKTKATTFGLYPNPVNDVLHVTFETKMYGTGQIDITHITGKVIYSREVTMFSGFNRYNFDMEFIPAGVYTVVVSQEDKLLREKVIKVNRP